MEKLPEIQKEPKYKITWDTLTEFETYKTRISLEVNNYELSVLIEILTHNNIKEFNIMVKS